MKQLENLQKEIQDSMEELNKIRPLYNNQVSAWFLSESRPTLSLGSAVRRRRSCFPLPFANYVIDGYESAHRTVF